MRKNRFHISTIASVIIAWMFIVLWMYTASNKLLDFRQFRTQIGQSPLIVDYAGAVSIMTPLIEIMLAALLFIDRTRLMGLYGSFLLLVIFSAYIIDITSFAAYMPCSCGGILENMTWNQHLVFNIIFVFLAMAGVVAENHHCQKYLLQQNRSS